MDDTETPSNTDVIEITVNSETAPEDTEVMSAASDSIRDEKISENSETAPEDTRVMPAASNSIRIWDEITSDLHLESIHSSMQSLVKEGSAHSMISITSMDEKSISLVKEGLVHSMLSITLKDENDQDDQEDKKDQVQEDNAEQKNEENKMKKQNARCEYIFVALATFICMTVPFIWYHLDRKEDVILPGLTYNQAEYLKSNDSCPFWEIIGDNYCDDEANILECGYDFNDCCKFDRDISLCTDCLCYIPEDKKILLEKQFEDKCFAGYAYVIEWETYFGDGNCDLGFNNKEHFFDIGDCCKENPTCMSSTFVSTASDLFCPENVCIQSNIFCNEEELGDGICQGHNNGPLCEYDLGDCCLRLVTESQTNCTCNCKCFLEKYYQIPWYIG